MDKVPYIDQSGLYMLEDIILDIRKMDIEVHLVGIQQQPMYMMERIDIIPDLVSKNDIYPDFKECLTHISKLIKQTETN